MRPVVSEQTIAEWQPELTWNLLEAERILADLTARGVDPPLLQSERRATLSAVGLKPLGGDL